MSHLSHLTFHVPDLARRRVLDLGAGRGGFLIGAKKAGLNVVGVEYNPGYIEEAERRAMAEGVTIELTQGSAEALPYKNEVFDFVNVSEVIEHVSDPNASLRELARVLAPGGAAYLSVPNRFGLKDQHYHTYFVNWMPRSLAHRFLQLVGKEKEEAQNAGRQKLTDMHYYTYRQIQAALAQAGLHGEDMRIAVLKQRFGPFAPIVMPIYYVARAVYFDAFHLLVRRK